MPNRLPDFAVPYRLPGDPIDPRLGSDWLSNLSRLREAEMGAGGAIGPELNRPFGPTVPIPNVGDEDLRRAMLAKLLAQRSL